MQDRLTEIEIKLAHVEQTVNELNDVIVKQQTYIDSLERGMERLKERLQTDGGIEGSGDPQDEKPPHY